jgi:hypothetical protein
MKRKLPRTKAEKLRMSGKICWVVGMLMTASFLRTVIQAQGFSATTTFLLALVAGIGVQMVITQVESALFDGTLPAPWAVEWSEGGPLPWLMVGAILCLCIDVLLNLGGVSVFTQELHKQNIGQNVLGMDEAFTLVVGKVITIALALLFAVGSELLEEFAKFSEGGRVARKQPEGAHEVREHRPEQRTNGKRDENMAQTKRLLRSEAQLSDNELLTRN